MYLTLVDTTQIQPYIFGSNRLRENIGASHLVHCATTEWAVAAVQKVSQRTNILSDGTLDTTKHIEDAHANLDAEVLYAAGGNFAVLFKEEAHAKAFTQNLSRCVLTCAPNLQIVVVHEPFDWNSDRLSEVLKRALSKLAEYKRARPIASPLLGLGVTVMCRSTGLPATQVVHPVPSDPTDAYPASAEIVAKIQASEEAQKRLNSMFSELLGSQYMFPRDFDELGRTEGEHSYIAVVHADGNGLGDRVIKLGNQAQNNRDYIQLLRQFSQAVETAARNALKDTLKALIRLIEQRRQRDEIVYHPCSTDQSSPLAKRHAIRIRLPQGDNQRILLPFRPIVFGGDDVTFVCDGRLGLSLALGYLKRLEQHTLNLPDGRGKLTGGAGVGIVKTHYPFARAYQLADELCKSAKRYRREATPPNSDQDSSYIDWHFALSGLTGDLETIRKREYTTPHGSLCLRPVAVEENPREAFRTWNVIHKGVEAFRSEDWLGRRNKLKALRDALREGENSVKHFLVKYNQGKSLPILFESLVDWKTKGWQGGYCGYFDAIELADWYVPIT
jgi:hypothetical protein